MYRTNNRILIKPSARFRRTEFSMCFSRKPPAHVGKITNTAIEITKANINDMNMAKFHAALSPKCFSIKLSFAGSSSSSSSINCSRTSAESISVFIPLTKESKNENTPLINGILYALDFGLFFSLFKYILSSGSLNAIAVHGSLRIITPSIIACPPIEVGTASFKKIFE